MFGGVTGTNVVFIKYMEGRLNAACNRYLAYSKTGIFVDQYLEM